MTESTPSEEQKLLIAGYVLHDLSPEEAADFEQLMISNPDFVHQELEHMQKALELVYTPSDVQPSAHLRASVLSAFQVVAQSNLAPTSSSTVQPLSSLGTRRNGRQGWLAAWGAIAASLIVGLSVSNLIFWKKLQVTQSQVQPPDLLRISLAPTAGYQDSTATVFIDPANLKATLRVENLPPLPKGRVYVLWTVLQPNAPFTTDDKNAILTEVFTVDEQNQVEPFSLPPVYREPQWIKAIAVTVEAASAPQNHLSSPILIEML